MVSLEKMMQAKAFAAARRADRTTYKQIDVNDDGAPLAAAVFMILILFPLLNFFARTSKRLTHCAGTLLFLMTIFHHVSNHVCDNLDGSATCPDPIWRYMIMLAGATICTVLSSAWLSAQIFALGFTSFAILGVLVYKSATSGDVSQDAIMAIVTVLGGAGGTAAMYRPLSLLFITPITGTFCLVAPLDYLLRMFEAVPHCPLWLAEFFDVNDLACDPDEDCLIGPLILLWFAVATMGLTFQVMHGPPPGNEYKKAESEVMAIINENQEMVGANLAKFSAARGDDGAENIFQKKEDLTKLQWVIHMVKRCLSMGAEMINAGPDGPGLSLADTLAAPKFKEVDYIPDWAFTDERREMAVSLAPCYCFHGDEELWPINVVDYFKCSTLFEPKGEGLICEDASLFNNPANSVHPQGAGLRPRTMEHNGQGFTCYHLSAKEHRMGEKPRVVLMRPELGYGYEKNPDINWEESARPHVPLAERKHFSSQANLARLDGYEFKQVKQTCFLRPTGNFAEIDFVYTTYFARSRLVQGQGDLEHDLGPGEYNFHVNCIVVRSNERNPFGWGLKVFMLNPFTGEGSWYGKSDLEWDVTHPVVFLAKGGHEPYSGPGKTPRTWKDETMGDGQEMAAALTEHGPVWRPPVECRSFGASIGNSQHEQALAETAKTVSEDPNSDPKFDLSLRASKPGWFGTFLQGTVVEGEDLCFFFSGRIVQRPKMQIGDMGEMPEQYTVMPVFRPEYNQFKAMEHACWEFTHLKVLARRGEPDSEDEALMATARDDDDDDDDVDEGSMLTRQNSRRANRKMKTRIRNMFGGDDATARGGGNRRRSSMMNSLQAFAEGMKDGKSRRRSSIINTLTSIRKWGMQQGGENKLKTKLKSIFRKTRPKGDDEGVERSAMSTASMASAASGDEDPALRAMGAIDRDLFTFYPQVEGLSQFKGGAQLQPTGEAAQCKGDQGTWERAAVELQGVLAGVDDFAGRPQLAPHFNLLPGSENRTPSAIRRRKSQYLELASKLAEKAGSKATSTSAPAEAEGEGEGEAADEQQATPQMPNRVTNPLFGASPSPLQNGVAEPLPAVNGMPAELEDDTSDAESYSTRMTGKTDYSDGTWLYEDSEHQEDLLLSEASESGSSIQDLLLSEASGSPEDTDAYSTDYTVREFSDKEPLLHAEEDVDLEDILMSEHSGSEEDD